MKGGRKKVVPPEFRVSAFYILFVFLYDWREAGDLRNINHFISDRHFISDKLSLISDKLSLRMWLN